MTPTEGGQHAAVTALADDKETLEAFREMRKAFQLAFCNPAGNLVLQKLAPFCRANESCAVPGDTDRTMLLEGRREVWLLIQNYLNLEPAELIALYQRRFIKIETGDDDNG